MKPDSKIIDSLLINLWKRLKKLTQLFNKIDKRNNNNNNNNKYKEIKLLVDRCGSTRADLSMRNVDMWKETKKTRVHQVIIF